MSKIKLEVGKTYRNRVKGEVTIIEYNNVHKDPYRYMGNDGEWYCEDGKFEYLSKYTIHDLIEEVEKEGD